MTPSDLPTLNALLNSAATFCLVSGYIAIRKQKRDLHRGFMASAFFLSICFLISYLIYHYHVGSIPFQKTGWIRPVYFSILISHILLAMAVPFLALATLRWAWKGDFAKHKRIARWTFPIWLYVSITGVAIYWMLYIL